MYAVTLSEAQARLPDLIEGLLPGEPILITRDHVPVARLAVESSLQYLPRKAGSAQGLLNVVEEDEEHLKDFKEYMG